jgi:hypothetical protein
MTGPRSSRSGGVRIALLGLHTDKFFFDRLIVDLRRGGSYLCSGRYRCKDEHADNETWNSESFHE